MAGAASLADTEAARLAAVWRAHGGGVPRLLMDLARVDANLAILRARLAPRALRLVVKSLPLPALLARLAAALGAARFMCFHRSFLPQLLRAFPAAEVLVGKPLPLPALEGFARDRLPDAVDRWAQVIWLIDDAERLARWTAWARGAGVQLRIAIELDVGLHRGGVPSPEALDPLLAAIAAAPQQLALVGFLGYDAHAAKAPWPLTPAGAARRAQRRYAAFLARGRATHPALLDAATLLDGGGSPTALLHDESSLLSEVALGSALVKPVDFDLPSLAGLAPALWIATPVLKRLRGTALPFLGTLAGLRGRGRDSLYVYGGRWLAEPCWPPGLRTDPLYGLSSNQQRLTVPAATAVAPEDPVFLRPTQSEAVMTQFGDVLAIDADDRVQRWPPFAAEPDRAP